MQYCSSSLALSITMVWWLPRISWHKVVVRSSSPPTFKPKPRVSSTAQAVQLFSVTRATAAKRKPVDSQITCKMAGTALIRPIVAMSDVMALLMKLPR
ncbi:hypothetical protein D3C71_1979610 [compost metagenome]